jgi:nucleotide-binding universal stress UspA family protein
MSVLDSAAPAQPRHDVVKAGGNMSAPLQQQSFTGGPTMDRIVVGTDGSEHATTAMRWAAEEAELHGSTLEAVLAWHYLDQHHPDHSDNFQSDYTENDARAALAAWVAEALGDDVTVDQRVVCDLPARALLEASDAADLLVLGARGTGGFEGLLFGSVSERVAQLASRPVAVVRAASAVRGGRVVVGVDGSARSLTALRWAAAEARARDADIDVVHAWRLPILAAPPMTVGFPDYTILEDSGRAVLVAALSEPALAGLRVRPHFVHENPARALIERAGDAGLVVAGTRGLGRVSGALLGSVCRQLLHHAPCPVVVI